MANSATIQPMKIDADARFVTGPRPERYTREPRPIVCTISVTISTQNAARDSGRLQPIHEHAASTKTKMYRIRQMKNGLNALYQLSKAALSTALGATVLTAAR